MNENNANIDPELLPSRTRIKERIALILTSVIAIVGLAGYTAWVYQVGIGESIPHLLGASIFLFGAGAGGFALVLNYVINPVVTLTRAAKAASVYASIVVLLTPLVDVGAFHHRLAIVFLVFLAGTAILYAFFHGLSDSMLQSFMESEEDN